MASWGKGKGKGRKGRDEHEGYAGRYENGIHGQQTPQPPQEMASSETPYLAEWEPQKTAYSEPIPYQNREPWHDPHQEAYDHYYPEQEYDVPQGIPLEPQYPTTSPPAPSLQRTEDHYAYEEWPSYKGKGARKGGKGRNGWKGKGGRGVEEYSGGYEGVREYEAAIEPVREPAGGAGEGNREVGDDALAWYSQAACVVEEVVDRFSETCLPKGSKEKLSRERAEVPLSSECIKDFRRFVQYVATCYRDQGPLDISVFAQLCERFTSEWPAVNVSVDPSTLSGFLSEVNLVQWKEA